MRDKVASFARILKCRKVKLRLIGATSKFSTMVCLSRSTWSSISRIG